MARMNHMGIGGVLTDVDIRGDVFLVDLAKDEMRLRKDPARIIRFDEMAPIEGSLSLRFLYDHAEKKAFTIPQGLQRLPEHVSLVELFSQPALDPIGYFNARNIHHQLIQEPLKFLRFSRDKVRFIPRVDINRDQFFVSVLDRAFIDTIDLSNRIAFKECHTVSKESTVLFYDPIARRVANHQDGTPGVHVALPPVSALDPDGYRLLSRQFPRPPAALARHYDAAMYHSKRTGRDTWFVPGKGPIKKGGPGRGKKK